MKEEIGQEQKFNFAPYNAGKKRKLFSVGSGKKKQKASTSWTHTFYCLARSDQSKIPGTMSEREALLDGGLGEQKITFTDMECSADEYKEIVVDHFPKLSEGGGYELMRCCPNSRELECISSNALKSPKATQERVGRSKVYIRPIQRNLDTTPLEDKSNSQTDVSCIYQICTPALVLASSLLVLTLYVVAVSSVATILTCSRAQYTYLFLIYNTYTDG